MTRLSGPGLSVLRGFIAASNEQYRAAGLGEYQMRVDRDGRVTMPRRPAPRFKPVSGTGNAAREQAAAGATAAPPSTASATAPGTAGPAPSITSLKPTKDGFAMAWEPVQGAHQYGIWVDGALVGHVPKPAFDGTLAAGSAGSIQVDAVLADGRRTQPTGPIALVRDAKGTLSVQQAPAATAPAAPAS